MWVRQKILLFLNARTQSIVHTRCNYATIPTHFFENDKEVTLDSIGLSQKDKLFSKFAGADSHVQEEPEQAKMSPLRDDLDKLTQTTEPIAQDEEIKDTGSKLTVQVHIIKFSFHLAGI